MTYHVYLQFYTSTHPRRKNNDGHTITRHYNDMSAFISPHILSQMLNLWSIQLHMGSFGGKCGVNRPYIEHLGLVYHFIPFLPTPSPLALQLFFLLLPFPRRSIFPPWRNLHGKFVARASGVRQMKPWRVKTSLPS